MLLKNSSFIPASTQILSPEGTGTTVDDDGVGGVVVVEAGAGVVAIPDAVVSSGVEVPGVAVLLGVAVSLNGLALWHSSVGHLEKRGSKTRMELDTVFLICLCKSLKAIDCSVCSPATDADVRARPEGLLLAAAQFPLLVVDAVLRRVLCRLWPNSPPDDRMKA